ncbi:MAG TPA: hypothetical protein VFJ85_00390 [Acidimicrobiales bacterium]|nr:hypothetical protein [Acidimicrobiales bacterium]
MATDDREWVQVLDRFEAYLAEEETALDKGGPHAPSPTTPEIGPLPQHLAPRAQALLARSLDLESRIEAAATAVRRRLVAVRHADPDAPALYVDWLG